MHLSHQIGLNIWFLKTCHSDHLHLTKISNTSNDVQLLRNQNISFLTHIYFLYMNIISKFLHNPFHTHHRIQTTNLTGSRYLLNSIQSPNFIKSYTNSKIIKLPHNYSWHISQSMINIWLPNNCQKYFKTILFYNFKNLLIKYCNELIHFRNS